MQANGLSLEQAPPIHVPLRFFLSAPWFALLAACLLLWQGGDLFANRWNTSLLAATHLLTLGFLGLVMLGALMQMLPVLAGTPLTQPVRAANIVHLLVSGGTLLLAGGFNWHVGILLKLAMLLLGTGLLYFAIVGLSRLRHALPGNPSALAMRLASIALAITAALGIVLASNHAWGWWLAARINTTNLHLSWGLFGWIGILVVGIAFRVVPMFQLTPHYPERFTRVVPLLLFGLLLIATVAMWTAQTSIVQGIIGSLLALVFSAFAAMTLWLQGKRRRKLPDVTLGFWRFAMLCMLSAALLWLGGLAYAPLSSKASFSLLLGILIIAGAAMSVANGMLYKIVPFLVWFHLQSLRLGWRNVPNVREILPERRTRPQMWLHFCSVLLLLAAAIKLPFAATLAALAFAGSNLWLWLNLLHAARIYRRISKNRKANVAASTQAG